MHLMSERAVMATGVVGGTLPIAVGAALRQPAGTVVVVFFGDGAVQNGCFHESMNLASLWNVPVLFVCENNGWAEFSPRSEHTNVGNVERYGELYRMDSRGVDGTNVEHVLTATQDLLDRVRDGNGPALLECHISRLRAHYEGDLRKSTGTGDPITELEQTLIEAGLSSRELASLRADQMDIARQLMESVLMDEPANPAADEDLLFARPLS
jgi:pyruvate dehydrogenase E1 component alpha subunit